MGRYDRNPEEMIDKYCLQKKAFFDIKNVI
jgi:hypothetical protein